MVRQHADVFVVLERGGAQARSRPLGNAIPEPVALGSWLTLGLRGTVVLFEASCPCRRKYQAHGFELSGIRLDESGISSKVISI